MINPRPRRCEGLSAAVIAVAILLPATVQAEALGERVLSFASDMRLHHDGRMTVTETIRVSIMGDRLERGIVRDFPTSYRTSAGDTVDAQLEIIDVLRNREQPRFRLRSRANGQRLYIREADQSLASGTHTFVITYAVENHLHLGKDSDLLHWPVSGFGWPVPLQRVEARLTLPEGWEPLRALGVAGPKDAPRAVLPVAWDGRSLSLITERETAPFSGVSLTVLLPKGLLAPPGFADHVGTVLAANRHTTAVYLVALIIALWYAAAAAAAGRRPPPGTTWTLGAPPEAMTPVAARVIAGRPLDDVGLAAALTALAVDGYARLHEDKAGRLSLERIGSRREASRADHRQLARILFGFTRRLSIDSRNRAVLQTALLWLRETLRGDLTRIAFRRNELSVLGGVALSAAGLAWIAAEGHPPLDNLLIAAGMFGGTVALVMLFQAAQRTWRRGNVALVFFLFLCAQPALAFVSVGLWYFAREISTTASAGLVLIGGLNLIGYRLIVRRTLRGPGLAAELDGFRAYLTRAVDRGAPPLSPHEFERYLPYAIALETAESWAERLPRGIAGAEAEAYAPHWMTSEQGPRMTPKQLAGFLAQRLVHTIDTARRTNGR